MGQVQFGGSWYMTIKQAASAWAATALPDTGVIDRDEDPTVAARELEAYCWHEAQKVALGAPDDVDADEWRKACSAALETRIRQSRTAA